MPKQLSEIYVVSGLPRSGTSLMMQMLQAGGIPLFTDDARPADNNNPRGYFEHSLVKTLPGRTDWLEQARGQAVKVISYLLPYLPDTFNYQIIFMKRDLDEIIRSQNKMLMEFNQHDSNGDEALVAQEFRAHLQQVFTYCKEKKNIELRTIPFRDLIVNPMYWAKEVKTFLNLTLNVERMSREVAPHLYRNRTPYH